MSSTLCSFFALLFTRQRDYESNSSSERKLKKFNRKANSFAQISGINCEKSCRSAIKVQKRGEENSCLRSEERRKGGKEFGERVAVSEFVCGLFVLIITWIERGVGRPITVSTNNNNTPLVTPPFAL